MAEKTATVRLRAVVDQYLTAIGKADKATGKLTDPDRFKKLGGHMEKVGGSLTRNLSLPLIATAGLAAKMSVNFSKIFAQMQGLAGVAADEVDGLKDAVLDLAGATGRGPQELAEGLYFVRSAGIAGKAAIEALEVSARGAAAGLGETAAIADAVTSALGAYGEANITAAEAGDVLAATAREGKAEAASLAPQFGRLLPIASQLGVRFDEVGGALAYLSRSGGGAELAATNLQNVLTKLLNPAEEGVKALEAMGMSTQTLRDSIKQNGLLDTLVFLRRSLEENGMELGDFSRDAQFTIGALALTAEEGDRARGVFDALAESTGSLDDAFNAAAQTDGFKMQQALAKLQTALIQIGDIIVPIAADVAGFLSRLASAFSALPGPVQTAIVALGGLLAVAGPLLTVGGKLLTNWEKISELAGGLGTKLGMSTTGMSRLGKVAGIAAKGTAGLLAAYVGLEMFAGARSKRTAKDLEDMFPDLNTADLEQVRSALKAYKRELDELDNREGKGKLFSIAGNNIFATGGDADRQEKIDQTREKVAALEATERDLTDAQLESAGSSREQADALGLNADKAAEAAKELQGYIDKLTAVFDPVFAMQDALAGEAEAREALNSAIKEHGASSQEAVDAEDELFRAIVATDGAALALKGSMDAGGTSVSTMAGYLDDWVESGRLTREQADRIAEGLGIATSKAEGFAGTYTATLVVDTAAAEWALGKVRGLIAAINGTPVNPSYRWTPPASPAPSTGKWYEPRALGGSLRPGQAYLVGEDGPEVGVVGAPGHMFDARSSAKLLDPSVGAGGGDTIVNVNVNNPLGNGREIAQAVSKELRTNPAFRATVDGRNR